MKNSLRLPLLLSGIFLLALTACNTEGFDGNGSISGKVAHHGGRISGATVFVKFGAKEFPGSLTTDYDASVIADTGGVYSVDNLKKGDYYLYGFGFDSTISQTVSGGLYVKLGKDEDKTTDLAVTE